MRMAAGNMTEQEFLNLLAARAGSCARGELGIGDDAALLAVPDGRLLVTTDAFVEGIHFPSWASPAQVARRCVIAALSDINAMGGTGRDLFVALGLPPRKSRHLPKYLDALLETCVEFGLRLMGGDTVASPKGMLSLTVTGVLSQGKAPLTRVGARPGDFIHVSGPLGRMGLAVARVAQGWKSVRGRAVPPAGGEPGLPDAPDSLAYFFSPQMPYPLGRDLLLSGKVTACMDISDGLSTDLTRLCDASGVGAEVEGERLPAAPEVVAAIADERERLDLLLASGEEFQLLFTSSEELPWPVIGRMTPGTECVLHWKGTASPLRTTGYDHFRHPA